MSYVSLLTKLDAAPKLLPVGGQELLLATSCTPDEQKILATLMCRADSSCAANFKQRQADDLVIVSGDLGLDEDGNLPLILIRSICKAHPDQFLNEVSVTGRLGGKSRETEKSIAESIAVDRGGDSDQPYWFRIRCFGANKTKLESIDKGCLVTASGVLEMRQSAEKQAFVEIKTRVLTAHTRGGYNPASGKDAAGYAQGDFDGDEGASVPGLPANWG